MKKNYNEMYNNMFYIIYFIYYKFYPNPVIMCHPSTEYIVMVA